MTGEVKRMSVGDLQKIAKNAEQWAQSDSGQKTIENTRKHVEETTAHLSKERIVDNQILRMPLNL